MADIRINALATTAASTASDDFIAVDGSANGTRKLNAYSPTFGGNLTVTGTGTIGGNLTVSSGSLSLTSPTGSAATFTNTTDNNWSMKLIQSGGNELQFSGNITGNSGPSIRAVTSGGAAYAPLTVDGSTATVKIGGVSALAIDASKNATLSGNLTVSGGTTTLADSSGSFGTITGSYNAGNQFVRFNRIGGTENIGLFADNSTRFVNNNAERARITSGGNFLLGTTTDSGEKLQVNGTAAISGALSIGNTVQTAVSVASTHKVTISIGGSTYYLLATNV